ncbi:MAG: proton-conducting transporter membrane subunit [Microthrixaceae bacterium]
MYSSGYFARRDDLGRLAGLLVGFAGAMLGIVWADGLLTLFVFWELTSITSFLLIGFEDRSTTARAAAQRAFLVTGLGGLALLAGLVLLGLQGGTTSISALLADPPTGTVTSVALVLVLLGAFTKSAQFPFNFWLPGAMAAPTPVSAYLHSATMVKAGLVVVARFAPAFASVGPWRVLVVGAGLASLVIGGFRAMRQQDAKLALAHGTVSQLGFMMVLLGLGTPGTTYAGVAVLVAHALFKAALFLSVGVIDHSAGTRDMRRLSGLLRALPITAAVVIVASASMAAIPPTLGFVAKEKALDALLDTGLGAIGWVALVGVVAGSVLTVAYTIRIAVGLLGNDAPGIADSAEAPVPASSVHRPTLGFQGAPVLLGTLSLVFGLAAGPFGHWLAEVTTSLDAGTASKALYLWAGLKLPLRALGRDHRARGGDLVDDRGRHPHTRCPLQHRHPPLRPGLRRAAGGRSPRHRHLPERFAALYIGIVLTTIGAAMITALLAGSTGAISDAPWTNSSLEVPSSPSRLLALAVVRTPALHRCSAARRFRVPAGAGLPDPGSARPGGRQFLVETLTIVVFLLALARLPSDFHEDPPGHPSGSGSASRWWWA